MAVNLPRYELARRREAFAEKVVAAATKNTAGKLIIDLQLNPGQRFYAGWAQVWRGKTRANELIVRVKTNPHSPESIRGTLPEMNHSAFYDAFGIKEGDKMYLAPDKRVTIWLAAYRSRANPSSSSIYRPPAPVAPHFAPLGPVGLLLTVG
jgi:hypothetical protein